MVVLKNIIIFTEGPGKIWIRNMAIKKEGEKIPGKFLNVGLRRNEIGQKC